MCENVNPRLRSDKCSMKLVGKPSPKTVELLQIMSRKILQKIIRSKNTWICSKGYKATNIFSYLIHRDVCTIQFQIKSIQINIIFFDIATFWFDFLSSKLMCLCMNLVIIIQHSYKIKYLRFFDMLGRIKKIKYKYRV